MPEHHDPKNQKALVSIVYEDGTEKELVVPPNRDPVIYLCGVILGGQQKLHDRDDKNEKDITIVGGKLGKHLDRHKIVLWTLTTVGTVAAVVLTILDLCGRL